MTNLTVKPMRGFLLGLTAVVAGACAGCDSAKEPETKLTEEQRREAKEKQEKIDKAMEEECFVMVEAYPDYGTPPLEVSFSADIECTEGATVNYAWDFGDGSPASKEASPTHVYKTEGDYPVTLNVTDSAGAAGNDDVEIFVEDDAEEAG
jgi:hypothetical protein